MQPWASFLFLLWAPFIFSTKVRCNHGQVFCFFGPRSFLAGKFVATMGKLFVSSLGPVHFWQSPLQPCQRAVKLQAQECGCDNVINYHAFFSKATHPRLLCPYHLGDFLVTDMGPAHAYHNQRLAMGLTARVVPWPYLKQPACKFGLTWLWRGLFFLFVLGIGLRLLVACWLWLFASSAFPVPLRQVAVWLLRLFVGLCGFLVALAFCILCFY